MENETSTKVYWLSKIAIILTLALVICACFLSIAIMDRKSCVVNENGDAPVNDTKTAISFNSAASLTTTESEYTTTINATVTPIIAGDQYLNWSVDFVNASSTWAKGKRATDYVSVTPTTEGGSTATVRCLQPFGEQIKITATSRDNDKAKAECRVDFVKQILDLYAEFDRLNANKAKVGTMRFDDPAKKYIIPSDTHYLDRPRMTVEYTDYTIGEMDEFDIMFFLNGTFEMYQKLQEVTGVHFTNDFHRIELGFPSNVQPGELLFRTDYRTLTWDPTDEERSFFFVYEDYMSDNTSSTKWRQGITALKNNVNIPYVNFSAECYGGDIGFKKEFLLYASPELFTV